MGPLLMADFPKRAYQGALDLFHADSELAAKRMRDTIDENAAYTPSDASDWNDDAPATVKAALDRIAAALGPIT